MDRKFFFGSIELMDVKNFVALDFQFLGYFEFNDRSQEPLDDDFKNAVFEESEYMKVYV